MAQQPKNRSWLKRLLDGLSLPAAGLFSGLGLLLVALAVLWGTGVASSLATPETPWGFLYIEPMTWTQRLTYAAAVATGVGAIIALVVSYRKQRATENNQFGTDFAAAAEQLGSDAPAVRIAGAYALATLADKHPDRRQQCIDVLCGYLRLPYDPQTSNDHITTRTTTIDGETITRTYRPADREVRLTIIRIIRDHLQNPNNPTTWCGNHLDFTGATFDGGDFTGAHFTPGSAVNFTKATFTSGMFLFSFAKFSGGSVTFDAAKFSDGSLLLHAAEFSGGFVSFIGLKFSGGSIDFDHAEFNGGSVTFAYAELSGGSVTFDEVTHKGGRVDFDGATFNGGVVTRDGRPFRGWSYSPQAPH